MKMEREEISARLNARIEELIEEVAMVQRDRDQQLIMAENDKQQVRVIQGGMHFEGV